jgi:hypothetical protein
VVEADIRSPTDSGLCAHAVSRLASLARRIKATGAAKKDRLRDCRRSVGKRVRAISALGVRGRDARQAIDRPTGEIAEPTRQTVREACAMAERARRSRRPRARAPMKRSRPKRVKGVRPIAAAFARSRASVCSSRSEPLLRFAQRGSRSSSEVRELAVDLAGERAGPVVRPPVGGSSVGRFVWVSAAGSRGGLAVDGGPLRP